MLRARIHSPPVPTRVAGWFGRGAIGVEKFQNTLLVAFVWSREGVAGIDYAFLAGLVALAIVAAVGLLGDAVEAMFVSVQSGFTASMPSGG